MNILIALLVACAFASSTLMKGADPLGSLFVVPIHAGGFRSSLDSGVRGENDDSLCSISFALWEIKFLCITVLYIDGLTHKYYMSTFCEI